MVTRPQPGAAATAERLKALGFDPVIMPITKIVGLPHTISQSVPDLVVATSPQAFRHLDPTAANALSNVPVIVTGKATATAAHDAGFLDITVSGGDVSRLISSLSSMLLSGPHVLYLAGRVRRPDLEQHLVTKTAYLSIVEVYDTIPVSYSTEKINLLMADGELRAVLLTSVCCAERLSETGVLLRPDQPAENIHIICLSQRIANVAKRHFSNPVKVASSPTEDALLDCLVAGLS